MSNPIDDIFGEPISIYTDQQALDDGVLVTINDQGGVNRVTCAVFDHFVKPIGDPALKEFNLSPLLQAIRAMRQITPDDGWRTGEHDGKILWLIPNEVGGLTLMFPEDY